MGGQVVEPEWLGTAVRHRAICCNGHECTPRPADVGQGQGICKICAGNDSSTAWRVFQERVIELRGRVIEAEWLGTDMPHRVVCQEGHETKVRPGSVRGGQGICRFCAGKFWDVFYVVTNDEEALVKFGITSGDPRCRLQAHRRSGYESTVRIFSAMADAASLESSVLATLRLAGIAPVQGREYYNVMALPVILDIVDNWPTVMTPGQIKARPR
ncbi:hypothetical protein [Streptomyces lavendulae]|uniref:hypothetical protein n=1 Tax=Streptomyces lavendulae TaxID=1914 RepID=UPI0031EB198E